MRWIVIALVVATACRPKAPVADVDPVTDAEARAFVPVLTAAIKTTCDEPKLDALIDHDALAARFAEHSHLDGDKRDRVAAEVASRHSGTKVLCAWFAVNQTLSYRLLSVDANAQPLVRRISLASGHKASSVQYFRFALGKSRKDGVVRIVDAYTFVEGEWLATVLAQINDAALETRSDDAFKLAAVMKKIQELRAQHQPQQAMIMLDTLSPSLKAVHNLRLIRVSLAKEIGQDQWLREVDAMVHDYPADASVALIAIDAAVVRGDREAALRYIDIVDKAVGGDPFQTALRASIMFTAGDIAAATKYADAAIAAEPTLPRAHLIKLDTEIAQDDWAGAVATLERLDQLGQHMTDDKLRAAPGFAKLLASDEYRAWRAKQPSTTP